MKIEHSETNASTTLARMLPLAVIHTPSRHHENAFDNFIKKETLAQVFSCEFCEICKNNFSYSTLPVAASVLVNTHRSMTGFVKFFLFVKERNPVETRRRFNVNVTSHRRWNVVNLRGITPDFFKQWGESPLARDWLKFCNISLEKMSSFIFICFTGISPSSSLGVLKQTGNWNWKYFLIS